MQVHITLHPVQQIGITAVNIYVFMLQLMSAARHRTASYSWEVYR